MDELKRLVELLATALEDLERLRGAIDTFRQADTREPDELRRAVKVLLDRVERTHVSLRAELAESADIAKGLEGRTDGPAAAAAVAATDLAKGFRSVIQTLQREVGEGDVGDVGTIIKTMEVELKGLIVVEDQQPKVVPPSPDQTIDANILSTIRMSFASVPIQRAVEPEDGPG
jgi:hypothetical protein